MFFRQTQIWMGIGPVTVIGAGIATGISAQAQLRCNAPAASPSVTIALPSNPFAAKPSADGCWVFVSVAGANGGIAVLKRQEGHIEMQRVVRVTPAPAGIALTHDGQLLVAAANNSAVILDVARMTAGAENPILGTLRGPEGKFLQSVYVNITADDKLLFVSEEAAAVITVIDFQRARANGFKADAFIGDVPVGGAPIALTFSSDGKWLYTTSESASPDWKWPRVCKPEGLPRTPGQFAALKAVAERQIAALQAQLAGASEKGAAQLQQQIDSLRALTSNPSGDQLVNPEGAVVVVDVGRARTDPANAVTTRIPAGCSTVRMAISPDGRRIYVTARNSNAVEVFDTAKLASDPDHSRLGMTPVGEAPVPVAVIDGGKKVVAGNSNRFAGGNAPQTLSVLDAAKMERKGADAALGPIPAGAFPRELSVSADGHTLFLTNAGSSSLQVIDIDRLPVEPPGKP